MPLAAGREVPVNMTNDDSEPSDSDRLCVRHARQLCVCCAQTVRYNQKSITGTVYMTDVCLGLPHAYYLCHLACVCDVMSA